MTSYHVSVLYNKIIGVKYPSNDAQFNKCCTEYVSIKLPHY